MILETATPAFIGKTRCFTPCKPPVFRIKIHYKAVNKPSAAPENVFIKIGINHHFLHMINYAYD